jgi:hypothetical protein
MIQFIAAVYSWLDMENEYGFALFLLLMAIGVNVMGVLIGTLPTGKSSSSVIAYYSSVWMMLAVLLMIPYVAMSFGFHDTDTTHLNTAMLATTIIDFLGASTGIAAVIMVSTVGRHNELVNDFFQCQDTKIQLVNFVRVLNNAKTETDSGPTIDLIRMTLGHLSDKVKEDRICGSRSKFDALISNEVTNHQVPDLKTMNKDQLIARLNLLISALTEDTAHHVPALGWVEKALNIAMFTGSEKDIMLFSVIMVTAGRDIFQQANGVMSSATSGGDWPSFYRQYAIFAGGILILAFGYIGVHLGWKDLPNPARAVKLTTAPMPASLSNKQ